MIVQKAIHAAYRTDFDDKLSRLLAEGWRVVPQTYYSRATALEVLRDGKRVMSYSDDYFVVVERAEEPTATFVPNSD